MNVQVIREEIEDLRAFGETSYENCERLVLLEEALKYMTRESGSAAVHAEDECSMTEQEMAAWVGRMKNADGTTGAHWTLDQTEQFRTQREIDCDPMKFWVTMNMMYSDYCAAAKKNNANTAGFYVDMAAAFLNDADAQPDKLARYHEYVAKH